MASGISQLQADNLLGGASGELLIASGLWQRVSINQAIILKGAGHHGGFMFLNKAEEV